MERSRLLLDTCAAIWIVEDSRVEPEAAAEINRAAANGEPVMVSPITAWERGQLVAKGRVASPMSAGDWFEALVERPEMELAPLTPRILIDAWFLPEPLHRDPADRILIATARVFGLTIVTRDSDILRYSGRGHVRALRC